MGLSAASKRQLLASSRPSTYGREAQRKITSKAGKAKVKRVMGEFAKGMLHSGSKKGPRVKSRRQAVAIALSEASKA